MESLEAPHAAASGGYEKVSREAGIEKKGVSRCTPFAVPFLFHKEDTSDVLVHRMADMRETSCMMQRKLVSTEKMRLLPPLLDVITKNPNELPFDE